MYDLKIVNARYYDWDTMSERVADICIGDGKIMHIGHTSKGSIQEIDASHLFTSPGFIDIHMHEEELDKYPSLEEFYIGERMLAMGVTTVLGGNCGFNKSSVETFIKRISDKGAPVNYMLKLGVNTLRESLGLETPYDAMTEAVFIRMKDEILRGMELGLKGLSFGIEYSPGIGKEEMISSAKLLDSERHIVSAHYRYDTDRSLESVQELIDVSSISKIPMQISHIGSCSAYGYMSETLEAISIANTRGLDITADCYPYNAFCSFIGSEVFNRGCVDKWHVGYEDILLTEEPYRNIYCSEELLYKARGEYPDMLAVAFAMKEEEVISALKSPHVMIASDGIYNGDKGHPRGAGTFPRVISKYVRDHGSMSLEDALYKMTAMPAKRLGLQKKGAIKEGYDADITIFDYDTIEDKADFILDPTAKPEGITHVIVNGNLAVYKGERCEGSFGEFIKA